MPGGWWCCCQTCWFFFDDFNRGEEVATDWKSPRQTDMEFSGGFSWADDEYIKADDDQYAESAVSKMFGYPYTGYLFAYDFDFDIPFETTVTGVEVRVRRKASAAHVTDHGIYLHMIGEPLEQGDNLAGPGEWSLSEEICEYGDKSNSWGWDLSAKVVNSSVFGVSISAEDDGVTAPVALVDVDQIEMRVWYNNFTDLGPDWKENRGDWGIYHQQLVEPLTGRTGTSTDFGTSTSTSEDAYITCLQEVPLRSAGEMYISVDIWNPTTGDLDYIYPCCINNTTPGPVEVEFECLNSPATWKVTIRRNDVDKESMTVVANVENPGPGQYGIRVYVCADHEAKMVKAGVIGVGAEPAWADDCDPEDGTFSALAHHNADTGVIFDDFRLDELRRGSVICVDCFCWCLHNVPSKSLLGTVYPATGRAACMQGLQFDLDWEWASGASYWRGTLRIPSVDTHGLYQDLVWILRCQVGDNNIPSWPGKNFSIQNETGACCTTGCGPAIALSTSACDPLNLVFGPFEMRSDDFICYACYNPFSGPTPGYYYIVVTDKKE